MIPRGVVVASLGRRLLAAVIDTAPFVAIYLLQFLIATVADAAAATLVAVVLGGVLAAGFALYQWWAYATRGAGIGARATGLRLVSLSNGEPIGWWRFFLREAVYVALMSTVVGGIALLIFLVIHERRQGWHDLAAGSVLVQRRSAPAQSPAQPQAAPQRPTTVGLPPHLASTFSPQPGTSNNYAAFAPDSSAPDWLPGVQSEPLDGGVSAGQQTAWTPPPSPRWTPQTGPSPQPSPFGASLPPTAETPLAPGPRPTPQWIPLPTPSSVLEPSSGRPRVRQREFGEVEEADGTRIAQLPTSGGRPGDAGWFVRLDDGREVDLTVTVLLGRNPQKSADDPRDVHLVPASGDGRMISRTHVLIGTDLRGVFVVDRGSTNGTALVTAGGELEPCPADTQVRVKESQQVSYGNRWFTVLRRPER